MMLPQIELAKVRRRVSGRLFFGMTAEPTRDQARNLAELRAIAQRLGLTDIAPGELAERFRGHAEAPTFLARLRRSGLSDAAVVAALFDTPERSGPPSSS